MKRLLPFVLCLSLFLTACGGAVRPTAEQACDKTIFAMDTVMDLTAYGPNADQALTDVVRRINDLEKHLSVTREDSDVWAVNHARGEPVGVSEDVGYLVESAQALGAGTGGALDITLYRVLLAWGFTTGD